MSAVSQVLGQVIPGAVLTDLYVAPRAVMVTTSVIICNQGVFAEAVRLAVVPAGAATVQQNYIEYDTVVAANSSITVPNIFLRASDAIRVYASTGNVSFTAMGSEER